MVHDALPRRLAMKIGRRTITRRLADKGYTPQKKLSKTDPPEEQKKKRIAFCKEHKEKNANQWKSHLQAVGGSILFCPYLYPLPVLIPLCFGPWPQASRWSWEPAPGIAPWKCGQWVSNPHTLMGVRN